MKARTFVEFLKESKSKSFQSSSEVIQTMAKDVGAEIEELKGKNGKYKAIQADIKELKRALIVQKGKLITGTKDDGVKVQFDNFVISLNKLKYDNKDYYVILTE